jgi:predicted amidohydrolase
VQRTLRIAALQLSAHDRAAFRERLPALLERVAAAAADAELLVVPEGTMPAYVLGEPGIDGAAPQEAIEGLRAIAQANRCVIVAGVAKAVDRELRNSAIVIDADGSTAGRADKIFLWHFDRKWFAPGDELTPIRTSLGVLGVMICADGRMPGIGRALVDAGAELLVMPTAWVTSGRNAAALENVQADLLAQVRAFENNVPFVAANKCGVENTMVAYCGKSQIVDRDGSVIALASERNEETLSATLSLQTPAPFRSPLPVPAPRGAAHDRAIRVAISPHGLPADIERRLNVLDAELAIAPGAATGIAALDRIVPTASLEADAILDPGTLVAYRMAGYRCAIVVTNGEPHPWLERVARARALELRMYVIVLEPNRRAYAVDPDGICIAGTFDGFRIASFSLDAPRTQATAVAPGTDIATGIQRVASLSRRESRT